MIIQGSSHTLQKTPAGWYNKNTIVRLRRRKDTNTPKTRAVALVPRKRESEVTLNRDRTKKMKKVHNTRSKNEEEPTSTQTAILEDSDAQEHVSSHSSGSGEVSSTPSDWIEIMEREAVEKNQQREAETNDFREENSTVIGVEGSGNLYDGRSGEASSPDLHTGINIINRGTVTNIVRNEGKVTSSKEANNWTGLFTKLTRGRATYSTFSPRVNITTKNNNALMFDIQKLKEISMNEIVSTLYSKIGTDFIGAKPHFVKGVRSYLEIIFSNECKMRQYAKDGINMFRQTFYGYMSTRSSQELLSVRLRRVPITDKEVITEEIKAVFGRIGTIMAIKSLLYEETPIQSDQWVVIFDATEDYCLTSRIPRFVSIMDQKVVTEWKEAPKLCFFCDGEGHIKKDCAQFKEANKLNRYYKEFRELKIN